MFEELKHAVVTGNVETAREVTADALRNGVKPGEILNDALLPGMDVVGQKRIKEKSPGTKVIVGGAPITREFADKVGADGFAPDALRAIHLAKTLVGKA